MVDVKMLRQAGACLGSPHPIHGFRWGAKIVGAMRAARSASEPTCLLQILRMWNSELPITPKWDCLDLFSGQGSVKADSMCFQPCWQVFQSKHCLPGRSDAIWVYRILPRRRNRPMHGFQFGPGYASSAQKFKRPWELWSHV